MNKDITAIFLPTDKASNIYRSKTSLDKSMKVSSILESPTDYTTNYFLYILGDFKTSEDKCKQGEWKYCSFTNGITKYDQFANIPGTGWCEDCRKIIGTNDSDFFISVNSKDTTVKFPGAISFSDMEYITDSYNGDANLPLEQNVMDVCKLAEDIFDRERQQISFSEQQRSIVLASMEAIYRQATQSYVDSQIDLFRNFIQTNQLSSQWEKYLHADYKPYAKGTGLKAEYEEAGGIDLVDGGINFINRYRPKLDKSGNIIIHRSTNPL